MLTEAILLETGKGDLLQEVEFESKKAARSLASAIGNDGKIKYLDLRRDHREELELDYADDETLAILKYFPDLKTVQVHSGDITSLGELKDCSKLETLELAPGVFPVKYPKKARFEVTLMQ